VLSSLAVSLSVQAAPFAYIAKGDNTVTVIDTATNSVVVPPISLGAFGVGVAVSPNGDQVYFAGSNVHALNTGTNAVTTVTTGCAGQSRGAAVKPDGTRVYVTCETGVSTPGSVYVIDASTNTVAGSPIPVGVSPNGLAFTPDGTRVYVGNDDGTVSVIDTASNSVIGSLIIGGVANLGVAVKPDGTQVYITNFTDNLVGVVDTATNSLLEVIELPAVASSGAYGIAVTPDGTRVYVADSVDNIVFVIDTASNSVVESIPVGSPIGTVPRLGAIGVAVTPDGSRLYVVVQYDGNGDLAAPGNVAVIDTATNDVIDTIPVESSPQSFGIFIVPAQVRTPPSLTKAFAPSTITDGGTTTLTFTITNPANNLAQTVGFADNLPSNLQVASPNSATSSCGGTVTATPGSGVITVVGAQVAPTTTTAGQCTIQVSVTNRAGQLNASCASLPAEFTNAAANIQNDASFVNSVEPSCVVVLTPGQLQIPEALPFGSQTVGFQSNPVQLTISNIGQTSVTLTDVTFMSGQFPSAGTTTCNNQLALAPNSTCQIGVAFLPTAEGPQSGTVVISSTGLGSPQTIQLSGTGRYNYSVLVP